MWTVPDPEVNDCEVFEGLRDRGRGPLDVNLRSRNRIQWSPEGSNDPEIAENLDRSLLVYWEQANPSMYERVYPEATQEEFDKDTTPGKTSFSRERLSIWPDPLPRRSNP